MAYKITYMFYKYVPLVITFCYTYVLIIIVMTCAML